jgi:hypothetical protein
MGDEICIVLVSNSSTESFSENSLTAFTNILPAPIVTSSKDGRCWFASLETLSLNAELSRPPPKYIRVVMSNLKPCSGSQKLSGTTLAVIPYSVRRHSSGIHIESRTREFTELDGCGGGEIATLSILLQDESGEQLRAEPGQPTYARLLLRRMKPGSTFMMRFSNRDSNSVGSASNFRVDLRAPMTLTRGSWQVALTSMQFPNEFLPMVPDRLAEDMIMYIQDFPQGRGRTKSFHLEPKDFGSPQALVTRLQELANGHLSTLGLSLTFSILPNMKLATIKRVGDVLTQFNLALGTRLGFGADTFRNGKIRPYVNGRFIQFVEPINVISNKPPETVSGPFPRTALLYSNLAQPTPHGDKLSNILKMIPLRAQIGGENNSSSSYISYECRRLDYSPVASDHIASVTFALGRFDGGLAGFKNENEEVLYNVVFRKIK